MDYLTEFKDDCKRIQRVAKSIGVKLTLRQACGLWKNYSEDFAASFLILPEKNTTLKVIILEQLEYDMKKYCKTCGRRYDRD